MTTPPAASRPSLTTDDPPEPTGPSLSYPDTTREHGDSRRDSRSDPCRDSRPALKTWPLDRHAGWQLLVAYTVTFIVLASIGLVIVHVLDHSALQRFDVRVSRWFERQRTPTRNDLGQIGSGLADAYTLTPGVILSCALFLAVWKRWHDVIMLGGALLMEKLLFLPVTWLVGRDRPPVPQLDGAPPTSSYPSGHVAAGVVAYVALAIVIRWHIRNQIVRSGVIVLAVAAPVTVAVSRLYLGMHHVTDVVAGLGSATLCLVAVHYVLSRSVARRVARDDARSDGRSDLPERARRLDLTTDNINTKATA
jgi:membrane-associated phospholipid phosphatase